MFLLSSQFPVFLCLTKLNTLRRTHESAPEKPAMPRDEQLLTEIRDILSKEKR